MSDGKCRTPRHLMSTDETKSFNESNAPHLQEQFQQLVESIKDAEENFSLLFDNNPHPMWIYALDTLHFLSVNEAAISKYGFTREEFLRMTIREIRPPEEIPILEQNIPAPGSDFIVLERIWRHRRKDGSIILVEITSHTLKYKGKDADFVTAFDVTERKRAEDALKASESKYRALMEQASDGIVIFTTSGDILEVNNSFCDIVGNTCEELVKLNVLDLVDRHELINNPLHFDQLRVGNTVIGERHMLRKDGTRVGVEVSMKMLNDGRIQAIVRDIEERKRAEQALRESEERYREMVENAIDMIVTHDLEGRFTSANKACEKLTGYTRDEAIQLTVPQVVAPKHLETVRKVFAEKMRGVAETFYEVEIKAKDGRLIPLEISSRLNYRNGAPVGVQIIGRDITRRRQLEEQLQQAQKMEAIGRLAGGIAHDFNNLLTAITGYSELALRKIEKENPLARNITEIRKAAERATILTRQLLAFSRKQMLKPKIVNLNQIIGEMSKMIQRLIGEDVELEIDLDPQLGQVEADPNQIEQVIVNLAVNARDAMPQGGKLSIKTCNAAARASGAGKTTTPQHLDNYVLLAVSDTGHGIDAETQQHIFEPFFTTKETGKGTGLGLSTVYGIVKQSEGYISVASEVGSGTLFRIHLPRVDQLPDKVVLGAPAATEFPRGKETILLVEDDELVRHVALASLELSGFRVLVAANGMEGLELCEQNEETIDLMLTDVVMPQMSGRELAEKVASIRPQIKILYMSGYNEDAIIRHGLSSKQINFIQKPFTPEQLARRVQEALQSE